MSVVEVQSILYELAEYRRFKNHIINRSEELSEDSVITTSMKDTFKMFSQMFQIVRKSDI